MNIRTATSADAETIAHQRGQMFVDMGEMTAEEAQAQQTLWADWLRAAILAGDYVGLLAEVDGVVGGVGLMFRAKMPSAKDPALTQGYILNMYVAPEHRRKGISEALMRAAMAEARAIGVLSLSLHAAPMGKKIYERLGFTEVSNPEMRRTLERRTWTFHYAGGFSYRRVTPADLPAFLAVMQAAGMDPRSAWNSTTVADLEKTMSGPHSGGFLALDSGGEAVGCVGFRPDLHDPHTLTLNKLATLPQVRGQGVARHLVGEVEGVAAHEGFRRVLLAVSQVNLSVQPFYEGLGYRPVDETYAFSSGKNGRPVVLVKEVAEGRWQKAEGSRAGQ